MTTNPTQLAPYAPVNNVLGVIRRLRERGLPDPLTLKDIERIGIPAGNASRTLATLRFLGLIEESGQRTALFERLGRASTNDYQQVLTELLKAAYSQIFTVVDPSLDSETDIQDAFRHYRPQAQRERMVTLFMGLAREAGIIGGGPVKARTRTRKLAASQLAGRSKDATVPAKVATATAQAQPATFAISVGDTTDYRLITALIQQLPNNSRWSQSRRDKWLSALQSAVDLLIEVAEEEE
jgi:hypothetical protein